MQWVQDELVVHKGNFAAVLRRLNACTTEHQVCGPIRSATSGV